MARDGSGRARSGGAPWERASPGLLIWAASFLCFLSAPPPAPGAERRVPLGRPLAPRGRALHLPPHWPLPPRSPWECEAETAQLAPSGRRGRLVPAGTAHPAPASPPLPRGRASLTGRVAGNSTWFPWVVLQVKEVRDTQVSTRLPWVTPPPSPGPPDPRTTRHRTLETNPNVRN